MNQPNKALVTNVTNVTNVCALTYTRTRTRTRTRRRRNRILILGWCLVTTRRPRPGREGAVVDIERRVGELLHQMPDAPRVNKGKSMVRVQGPCSPTLKDLGISKNDSSRLQKLHGMTEVENQRSARKYLWSVQPSRTWASAETSRPESRYWPAVFRTGLPRPSRRRRACAARGGRAVASRASELQCLYPLRLTVWQRPEGRSGRFIQRDTHGKVQLIRNAASRTPYPNHCPDSSKAGKNEQQ